ncbi:MAG: 3-hydroxyacyl-CoA dehydrogenase family protein [Dehalococcoidia bacterium]
MTINGPVGVVGAGTMGTGITIVTARAGFPTLLFDLDAVAVERALGQIRGFLAKGVERGKISQAAMEASVARITPTTTLEDLAGCDVVIEAVFEDLRVKQELLARLERISNPEAVFASNTSTLSITEIAAGCQRPERVVGMHFCLPAQVMRLVEMSSGLLTDPTVFERAWQFCLDIGQQPVRTRDEPGFILNYFVVPFNNDAIRLVESGVAAPSEIDRAIKTALGYPMGPLELLDYVGLDTQLRLCEAFYPITHDPRTASPPLLRRMVAAGRLGRKTGHGFYTYEGSSIFGG